MQIRKFIKNEYIFSIGTRFLHILLSLFQSIFVARFLGASLKGTSAYIQSIASIGSILITFGMHQAYPYFRKKYGKDEILNTYMTAIYTLFGMYFLLAILLDVLFVHQIELQAAIFLIPLMGYSNIVTYVSLIETPNKRNTWWLIIYFIEVVFTGTLFFTTKSTIYWAIAILGFVEILKSVVFSVLIKVPPHFSTKLSWMYKELFKYGFFPMLALLMTTLNYRIDVLMLRQYSFISEASIGIYSIGITMSEKIVLISDTLQGILASKLAKGADESEVVRVCRLCFYASACLCILVLIFGEWVIHIMYGPDYNGAYDVVAISAVGAVIIGYFKLIAQYNIVNKMQVKNVIMLSVSIVVNIVGNLALVPVWGINGAALATCIGHLVCGMVFLVWFSKIAKCSPTKMVVPQKEDFQQLKRIIRK